MMQTALDFGTTKAPRRGRPSEPIVRTADKVTVGPWTYRWLMRRAWDVSKPTIFWGMHNPSDADGKIDDPTTWRVMEFSYRWGFGSAIVGNLHPLSSPNPLDVKAWRATWEPKNLDLAGYLPFSVDQSTYSAHRENLRACTRAIDADMTFVAAWGARAIEADVDDFLHGVQPYVEDEEFGSVQVEVTWHCLGTTASGAPIHPLARGKHRVPNDAQLQVWKRVRAGMGRRDRTTPRYG